MNLVKQTLFSATYLCFLLALAFLWNPQVAQAETSVEKIEESMETDKRLTIENNGVCAVNIYWWKADGDVFYTTLQPGKHWRINTADGHMWRAVDLDNVWTDLQYDKSYTVNHNATQTWTITPDYCETPVVEPSQKEITIRNNGTCAVNIYWWKADGDVFYTKIDAGGDWTTNTSEGHTWRAVDLDNVWTDLQYDESYTVNHNAAQTWNITPDYCETPATTGKELTIKNNGVCAVNIYWWKADGDVFYTKIDAGGDWTINTAEGHTWRAVDLDNVWTDLQYDESYAVTNNDVQTWNITPDYCETPATTGKELTIKNNGVCAVNVYWWKADGDVFYTKIDAGGDWTINTAEGHTWRAVDLDNVWTDLQYDESYAVTNNDVQTWTITPDYCETPVTTNPNPTTCNATYSANGRTINIGELSGAIKAVKIIDDQWNTLYACDDWGNDPCGGTESFTVPTCGTYSVQIQTYADWSTPICNIFATLTINSDCGIAQVDCPTLNANIGDACNDGNANTIDDSVQPNCACAGTPVAPVYDCPTLSANIGDACNDGNANTNNDVVTASCGCAGTPAGPSTCEASYRVEGNKIIIEGLDAAINTAKILSQAWATQAECSDWSSACDGMLMATVPNGTYFVQVQTYADWSTPLCDIFEEVTVNGTDTGTGTGTSPVCDNITSGGVIAGNVTICSGEEAGLITNSVSPSGGTGDIEYLWLSSTTGCPRTLDQVIEGANEPTYNPGVLYESTYFVRCSRRAGCDELNAVESNCVLKTVLQPGILFGTDCQTAPALDCPTLNANIGDACNDGDDNTINDQVQSDCTCAGTPVAPVYDCPTLSANIGDACNDGNANTNNDVVTASCGCAGTPAGPSTCEASYRVEGNKIIIEGLDAAINSAKILSQAWATQAECSDWSSACDGMLMATVPNGTYFVQVQTYADWSTPLCDIFEEVTVNGTDTGTGTGTSPVCDDLTSGGVIAGNVTICSGEEAGRITNSVSPSGGTGDIEYLWLSSTTGCPRTLDQVIEGANEPTYDPGVLYESTYFVRCSRRAGCDEWYAGESNCVLKTVLQPGIFFGTDCQTAPALDCPTLNANIGDACNDGDDNTINDQVQSDCTCAGTPIEPAGNTDACSLTITTGIDFIEVSGIVGPYPTIGILDDFGNSLFSCHVFNGGCPETIRVDGLPAGVYWVNANIVDTDWVTILCEAYEDPILGGGARISTGNLNVEVEKQQIEVEAAAPDFEIYPNPANEVVNVSLDGYIGKDVSIQMIDYTGKSLKSINIDNVETTSYTIPIDRISNGIYTLRILSQGMKPVGKKMIVNKQF